MNKDSKITLSAEEVQLVNNTDWILTKRKIMDKVALLLGSLSERQRVILGAHPWLPAEATGTSPKISKGENYLQLPYMLLDHPRYFKREDFFAIRTMFWWGNFFSVTLHLSGKFKMQYQEKLLHELNKNDRALFLCVHEGQWHHHFEAGNYLPVNQMEKAVMEQEIINKPFVKVAKRFPLQEWDALPGLLENAFEDLLKMLEG
jgi:hypothetical protein